VQEPSSGADFGRLEIPGSTESAIAYRDGEDRKAEQERRAGTVDSWADVPWRTIVGAVGVVIAAYLLVDMVLAAARILTWVVVAGFFALVLAPLVQIVQRRLGGRRTVATGIVVFSTVFGVLGVVVLFLLPVRTQLVAIITDLPGTVQKAADGKGPIGEIVQKLHLERYVQDNEQELTRAANRLSNSSVETAQTLLSVAFAFVTITLITFLFLTQSPAMARAVQGVIPHRRRAAAQRIATDAAGAVSGYMIGNLLVSLIAGVSAFVCLVLLGVPNPVVLALWVAFADLIPMVGATLGAVVCVLAGYLQSPTVGVIALIFFVVYQQLENGAIYPWLMARKVKVNPLVVLLSVLVAVELFGIMGALLAVPVSGALQVVVKAVRQQRPLEHLLLPDSALDDPLE